MQDPSFKKMSEEEVREFPLEREGFTRDSLDPRKMLRDNFYKHPDLCNFDVWIDPDEFLILPKDSNSPTFQSIVKLKSTPKQLLSLAKNKKIFIKAFPSSFAESIEGEPDNSLVREIRILRYLSYLVKYRVTPCIQKYYADYSCGPKRSGIGARFTNKVESDEFWANPRDPFGPTLNGEELIQYRLAPIIRYTLSEYIEGKSLDRLLSEGRIGLEDLKSILFQILYTTWQFHLAGIRHNDLHAKNVLINDTGSKEKLTFIFGGKAIEVSGRYIPKIIDYDRAGFHTFKDGAPNIYPKSMCDQIGLCMDGVNRSYDPVRILTGISSQAARLSDECQDYLLRFYSRISRDPEDMLIKGVSKYKPYWGGCLCRVHPGTGKCVNWEPDETLMKFFPSMIRDNDLELQMTVLQKGNLDSLAQKYARTPDNVYASIETDSSLLRFLERERMTILGDPMEL